jgi:hypothetical protein
VQELWIDSLRAACNRSSLVRAASGGNGTEYHNTLADLAGEPSDTTPTHSRTHPARTWPHSRTREPPSFGAHR